MQFDLEMKTTLISVCLAFAAIASSPAIVVFGNLGPTGSAPISNVSHHDLNSSSLHAQSFITSASDWILDDIVLGLHVQDGSTINGYTINIYSNVGGDPGSLLYTSAGVTISGTTATKYTFAFTGVTLSASTTYWVVPSIPSTQLQWHDDDAAPTAQNGSGFGYAGPNQSNNGGATWQGNGPNRLSISVSGEAVPEPGTYLAGALLLGGSVITIWRRRRAALS